MRLAAAVVSLALAACAPRPQVSTSAAHIPPPVAATQAGVQLASYGVVDVRTAAGYAPPVHALHVRIITHDPEATPWTLDVREQRIEMKDYGEMTPALAAANPGTPPPVVTIAPHQTRVVDLFYLLPADLQRATAVPSFELLSSIHAGDRVIAARTPYARLAAEPVQFERYDYGRDDWAPPYWHEELPSELSTGPLTIRRNSGIPVGQ
jgi:hypothetical protein